MCEHVDRSITLVEHNRPAPVRRRPFWKPSRARRGTFRSTVLFVTHNAFEATLLSDRILMMTKGPGAKFCDEVKLGTLARPRSYENVAVFETSRNVVKRLVSHIGTIEEH